MWAFAGGVLVGIFIGFLAAVVLDTLLEIDEENLEREKQEKG